MTFYCFRVSLNAYKKHPLILKKLIPNTKYGTISILKQETDNLKQTALHLACKYSSDRVFKLLIDSDKLRLEHICNSSFDFSPLHSACRANMQRCDIVEKLLVKIIELKLNKMLRVHLNLTVRQKIVKNLLRHKPLRVEHTGHRRPLQSERVHLE